jgi:hypothetical protein
MAETPGSRRSCDIFVIGPLALSAGAKAVAPAEVPPISLAVFSSLALSYSQVCKALKSRVKELQGPCCRRQAVLIGDGAERGGVVVRMLVGSSSVSLRSPIVDVNFHRRYRRQASWTGS